jgi:DnaJ-class molecular chaperone
MNEPAKEVILVVEGDQELVECPECEGSEGYVDDNDCWVECAHCAGEGGYWRKREST